MWYNGAAVQSLFFCETICIWRCGLILLVWPHFTTSGRVGDPPLGLLKIAGYHRHRNAEVHLVREISPALARVPAPEQVCIGTLYTYDRRPVLAQVQAALSAWPDVEIQIGGVWASLLPENVAALTGVRPHVGLLAWAEDVPPAWDLWPGDTSWVVASRGCGRGCPWCAVEALDGRGFRPKAVDVVVSQIDVSRSRVVLWDNNILMHPEFSDLVETLVGMGKKIVVEQGFDARLVSRAVVDIVKAAGIQDIRISYDRPGQRESVRQALAYLAEAGAGRGKPFVYVLFNFHDPATGEGDTPAEIYQRIEDVLEWGAVAYPMRYRPIDSTDKLFVSPLWGWRALREFNKARGGRGIVCKSISSRA